MGTVPAHRSIHAATPLLINAKETMMNKFSKRLLVGLTVLGLSAGAIVAHADNDDGMAWSHGRMAMHDGADQGKFAEKMKERMAKHQAEMHDKLKLSAAQEPAWKTYVASMAPPAAMPQRPSRADMEKMSAPERMEKMLAMMKEHEAHMSQRLAAMKTFYAVLSPEQKKVFNDNFRMMHGRRHGGHHDGQ
jgi:Spy/CpxP family protein refolding chaperone